MASPSESTAVEDYLEVIVQLIDAKGYARVADVANTLGIAQPSVSNMVRRLDEKGLINLEKYRGFTLTEQGETLARGIVRRHQLLEEFLALLGIPSEIAYQDLEGMEHHISPQTLAGIEQLVCELRQEDGLRERVRAAVSASQTS